MDLSPHQQKLVDAAIRGDRLVLNLPPQRGISPETVEMMKLYAALAGLEATIVGPKEDQP